jgi:hypothetical protein
MRSVSDAVHIEDLAHPVFTAEVEEIRRAMASMSDECVLEPGALLQRARDESGLDDFGDRSFEEPLGVLVQALLDTARLSPVGRMMVHTQLVQLLKNRLLLTDLLNRHPEIHEIEVATPIVIAGLPRTGTTHLHNLLASDPALRYLPYWESIEPIPTPGTEDVDPDPRLERTEQGVWFMDLAMPLFPLMHEITPWAAHEEIHLLAIDFSTMFFETLAYVPDWATYYRAQDQTPHYRYLRTVLQALQHLTGDQRWVLKSPQHIEQFGPLLEVFPDATFVVTHRDPVKIVTSMATMVAYTARMNVDTVEPAVLGNYWADRIEVMLRACVRDRDLLPAGQVIDVRFDEFMADDVAMVRRIYELAEQPFEGAAESAMTAYLAEHRRGRLGRIDYRAADVGLDETELTERFAFYVARFL